MAYWDKEHLSILGQRTFGVLGQRTFGVLGQRANPISARQELSMPAVRPKRGIDSARILPCLSCLCWENKENNLRKQRK